MEPRAVSFEHFDVISTGFFTITSTVDHVHFCSSIIGYELLLNFSAKFPLSTNQRARNRSVIVQKKWEKKELQSKMNKEEEAKKVGKETAKRYRGRKGRWKLTEQTINENELMAQMTITVYKL